MALLNKDTVKNTRVNVTKTVSVGDYEVKIKKLGLKDHLEIARIKDDNGLVFALLLKCCVDEKNDNLFSEDDVDNLPPEMALKLFNECIDLNDLNKNNLEERAKNS